MAACQKEGRREEPQATSSQQGFLQGVITATAGACLVAAEGCEGGVQPEADQPPAATPPQQVCSMATTNVTKHKQSIALLVFSLHPSWSRAKPPSHCCRPARTPARHRRCSPPAWQGAPWCSCRWGQEAKTQAAPRHDRQRGDAGGTRGLERGPPRRRQGRPGAACCRRPPPSPPSNAVLQTLSPSRQPWLVACACLCVT